MEISIKPLFIGAILLGLFTLGPAPLRPYSDPKFRPEQSQEQRAEQQKLQGITAPVGVTEARDSDAVKNDVSSDMSSPEAKNAVAGARLGNEQATQAVKDATQTLEQNKSSGPNWIVGLVCIGGGFVGVMALKRWAEKQAESGARLVQ